MHSDASSLFYIHNIDKSVTETLLIPTNKNLNNLSIRMSHNFVEQASGRIVCSQCGKSEEVLSSQVEDGAPFRSCRNHPGN